VVIRVTPKTTLDEFIITLQSYLSLKRRANEYYLESTYKSSARLSVFVDDANVHPAITEFILRLTANRKLWHREQEVLATLSPTITVHLIASGKVYFDQGILNSLTHLPLVFNEQPLELLTGRYSFLLSARIEANLLKELLDTTSSVLLSKYPLLTGHDISKLYRVISHYEAQTK